MKRKIKINHDTHSVKFKLTLEMFEDIIVGALEQGSYYWMYYEVINKPAGRYSRKDIAKGLWDGTMQLKLYDCETDEFHGHFDIQRMIDSANEVKWAWEQVLNQSSDCEADDVIFQTGVFGEVIYG